MYGRVTVTQFITCQTRREYDAWLGMDGIAGLNIAGTLEHDGRQDRLKLVVDKSDPNLADWRERSDLGGMGTSGLPTRHPWQ